MNNTSNQWIDSNQRYLSLSVLQIREQLEQYKFNLDNNKEKVQESYTRLNTIQKEMQEITDQLSAPPSLESLATIFNLSPFEKSLLVICAGVELDGNFANLIATLQGSTNAFLPTFSFMLATMPDAHWSAVSPNAPLRYWRMIELNTDQLISKAPIKIDEHILHYIAGVNCLDERLAAIMEPFSGNVELVPSHLQLAVQIINSFIEKYNRSGFIPIQLSGNNNADKDNLAVYICRKLSLNAFSVSANAIPSSQKEITELTRLWNREAVLKSYALIINNNDIDASDKQRTYAVNNFINNIQSLLVIIPRRQIQPKINMHSLMLQSQHLKNNLAYGKLTWMINMHCPIMS